MTFWVRLFEGWPPEGWLFEGWLFEGWLFEDDFLSDDLLRDDYLRDCFLRMTFEGWLWLFLIFIFFTCHLLCHQRREVSPSAYTYQHDNSRDSLTTKNYHSTKNSRQNAKNLRFPGIWQFPANFSTFWLLCEHFLTHISTSTEPFCRGIRSCSRF